MLKIKKSNYKCIFLFTLLIFCAAVPQTATAQTTEFTYQGRLTDSGGMALTGSYDFEFRLYDANNNLLGTQTRLGVPVAGGAFTVGLDYGANPNLFTGAARLLQISVRPAGSGSYTDLNPRQPVTSAPYAIRSREATNADIALNSNQLGGVPAAQFVQTDASGNVSVGGNLTVGGTLTQAIVNAQTEYQIGGQRVLSASVSTENTFVGLFAGQSNTDGCCNSFFGKNAGRFDTTGFFNSFFGYDAGRMTTTGDSNSFFGVRTGLSNTTGKANSFFGREAGYFNTTGNSNSFFGNEAGFRNTMGAKNAFYGSFSGVNNTTGNQNSFFGYFAGGVNTTGSDNTFFGYAAGELNSTGERNSFFGTSAGGNCFTASCPNLITGNDNSFFGFETGFSNLTGTNNSFFGSNAGRLNTTGANITLVGAGTNVGANNLTFAAAFGAGAIVNSNNTVVLGRNLDTVQIPGNLNLSGNFTGSFVIPTVNGGTGLNSPGDAGNFLRSDGTTWTSAPFGAADIPDLSITNDKLDNAAVTADKIADGAVVKTLNNLTDDVTLVAGTNVTITPISGNSLRISATGGGGCGEPCAANIFNANTQYNIAGQRIIGLGVNDPAENSPTSLFVGLKVGQANNGIQNSFFGYGAGAGVIAPQGNNDANSFFGFKAGFNSRYGDSNSFFGARSGLNTRDGSGNSFFGQFAGAANVDGNFNSFFGNQAGQNLSSGDDNTFIGKVAGSLVTTGTANTFVGTGADYGTGIQGLTNATAIGAGAKVSTSNTIALGRTTGVDTVRIYGNLVVDGTTSFAAKQTEALEASVKKQDEQIQTQTEQIQKQITQIEVQQKLLVEQQKQIDALRKLICATNTTAEICKEVK